ncbi:MAG: hypothetical protein F9K47_12365 [Burkholderiales bacterium]|nr:MAG: hypothetical protein F9K47_12365 [Burkholderiales bacterium]
MNTWPDLHEMLLRLASASDVFTSVIMGVAFLAALAVACSAMINMARRAKDPSAPVGSVTLQWLVVGLLSGLSASIALTLGTVAGESNLLAYRAPAGTASPDLLARAVVVGVFQIVRVFGYAWFAHGVYQVMAISNGRGSDVTAGGVIVKCVFAALCVNGLVVTGGVVGFFLPRFDLVRWATGG